MMMMMEEERRTSVTFFRLFGPYDTHAASEALSISITGPHTHKQLEMAQANSRA